MSPVNTVNHIQRAIKAAGGAAAVAARFNINRVSVHEWGQNGSIPSDKAPIVAEMALSNGVYVPLAALCPSVAWEVARAHMDGLISSAAINTPAQA